MGFFGRFAYRDGAWREENSAPAQFVVDVHDSDIATIDYRPVAPGASGRCYVGYEPRHYFDDKTANAPVDIGAEARGLAEWAATVTGTTANHRGIKKLLASPRGRDPKHTFVEESLAQLLTDLGLPLPDGLPRA